MRGGGRDSCGSRKPKKLAHVNASRAKSSARVWNVSKTVLAIS